MDKITVSDVTVTGVAATPSTLRLHSRLTVPADISPENLCRLAVPRLPLSPSACIMLGLLLDEVFAGIADTHTYSELSDATGRGTHTAVRAAAELRSAGLLITVRTGARSGNMRFICTPLVRWAEEVLGRRTAQDAHEGTSVTQEEGTGAVSRQNTENAPDGASRSSDDVPAVIRRSMEYVDDIVDDRPDWPAVQGNWRGVMGIPLPDDDDIPSMSVPLHVKPWLGPLPRTSDGRLDIDKLVRMPHQLVMDSGDDDAIHAFCQEKGDRRTGKVECVVDDYEVDASEEREAERALADGGEDDGDDSFSFAIGADAAETDVGMGVVANPDL